MDKIKVFHNPSCSTSNKAVAILKELEVDFEPILYLEKAPSRTKIKSVLKKLGIPAEQLIRKKEPLFQENFADAEFSEEEWIDILAKFPKLIERPIVIKGRKAIIARPLEKINELIKKK